MYKVITTQGIKPITDVNIGDKLYEYGTGDPIEVKDVLTTECMNSVKITFTDGREEVYGCCEYVPVGVLVTAKEIVDKETPGCFYLYEVEFDRKRITEPLYPDPYVAGAFFMYGDYSDEYLNLPLNRVEANNNISHKYNIDYFDGRIGNNKVYYQWKGKKTDTPITWEEFFPGYDFYAKYRCGVQPPIPLEYMFGWKSDRVQFIRGAFDVGYHPELTPDQVSVNHWSKERLEWLQWMVWSMGIPAEIKDYPEYKDDRVRYQLNILGEGDRYPGFFYWSYLEQQIINDYLHPRLDHPKQFGIAKAELIEGPYKMITPVFAKDTIFLSAQFLPRCTKVDN